MATDINQRISFIFCRNVAATDPTTRRKSYRPRDLFKVSNYCTALLFIALNLTAILAVPLESRFRRDSNTKCQKSLDNIEDQLKKLKLTNQLTETNSSDSVLTYSYPYRTAYNLSLYLQKTSSFGGEQMYHAESKVAVNLMGARPENTMPGLGDKFHHSGERLINLCILFDQENIELAEMAKFSIQAHHKATNQIYHGFNQDRKCGVDYCYGFSLMGEDQITQLYEQSPSRLSSSDLWKNENGELEAVVIDGERLQLYFDIIIKNISEKSIPLNKSSEIYLHGFQLLVETLSTYDTSSGAVDHKVDKGEGPEDAFVHRVLNSDLMDGKEAGSKCHPGNYSTCADSSICCRMPIKK